MLLYVGSQKVKSITVQMRRDNQKREERSETFSKWSQKLSAEPLTLANVNRME